MTSAYDVRRAHDLLDQLDFLKVLSKEQKELLRSFIPELPSQKTLEELRREVYDVWVGTNDNEWPDDIYGVLETWLDELHGQLVGLKNNVTPAHPEFLETEADYENAPEGTIVASAKASPAMKGGRWWESAPYMDRESKTMAGESRRVLRWGWGND